MTRKTWAAIGIGATVVVASTAVINLVPWQIAHYAQASDDTEQIKINEDAIARVVELTVGLADQLEAEDIADEAERATLRELCIAGDLTDRKKCATVGVEVEK